MAAVTLTDLNYFMKNFPSGKIRPQDIFTGTLYDALKAGVKTERYPGDCYEMLIQTATGMTGQAFGRNIAVPGGQAPGWIMHKAKYAELIANTQVTKQEMDQGTGGAASWENIVTRLILDLRGKDFKNLLEHCAIGDGTGRLARCDGTETYAAGPPKILKVQCDNTYADWGWENVALLQPDMWVEIYTSAGVLVTDNDGATSFKVAKVFFGKRGVTGTPAVPSATNACVWLYVNSDLNATIDDNSVIYRKGTRSTGITVSDAAGTALYDAGTCLPIGLTGLVGDASHQKPLTKFQNLTRANYPILQAGIYDAADFATGGAAGTPDTWDLSDISGFMNEQQKTSGKWVTDLFCSTETADCMNRLTRAEHGVNVVVSTTAGTDLPAVGSRTTTVFIRPDGEKIPIHISRTVPRHVLYGICADDLFWLVDGDFDFMGPALGFPGVWGKTMGDRYANFEAPYGGYAQVAAEACNSHFCVMDLKDDL